MSVIPTWLEQAKQFLERSLHPVPNELNELDWKETLSPNTEKLKQHLSAFSVWPGGGYLVFGVGQNGKPIGIKQNEAETIISKLGSIAREGLEPAIQIHHELSEFEGCPLLFVKIPESYQKPVQFKGRSIEDSFIRSAGQTRRMSKNEIGQAILNSRVLKYEELDSYVSENPQEVLGKLDYAALYGLLNRPVPSTQDLLLEDLKGQKLITVNENRYAITNLGILICAKNMAEFPGHERRGIRVIFYKGNSRSAPERETIGRKGYAIGFKGLVQYIIGHLPSSEVIHDALRRTVSIYPEITIRELLANSLVHQDLSVQSMSPMVEVFSDRMEITNPGKLLPSVSVDRIIDTTPESRNEMMARFMRQLGICEERGSGIDRAIEAVELFGLPPLEFRETENSFKTIIFTPKKYNKMTKEERTRACFQHCVLKYICNDRMTNASLRKRLGVAESNYPMVSKIIKEAITQGRIRAYDPNLKANKHAQYVPYWA